MVEVISLVKRYGDLDTVYETTFNAMKGEIFAFLGTNGVRKTTTVKISEYFRVPTGGEA